MFDRLKLLFTRKVCSVQEFQYACDYAKTVVDIDENGEVSVWELFLATFRYILARKFE